jgi:hypothetical protein
MYFPSPDHRQNFEKVGRQFDKIRMTQRYAHLRNETLKKAANVAGRIIAATEQDAKKAEETKTGGGTS